MSGMHGEAEGIDHESGQASRTVPRGALAEATSYVDAQAERFIGELCEFVRHPSESGRLADQQACAAYVVGLARSCGWTAEPIQVDDLAPIVYAHCPGPPGAKRVLLYSHYDVVPAGAPEAWSHPPYAAARVDGRIVGRGTTDAKANALALMKAVESFVRTRGGPPCGTVLILDGEEERGSPNLDAFVERYRDRLAADAALSFDGAVDPRGVPKIGLGTSGMLYVELEAAGASTELHSAGGRLYPNPAWRLIWALASVKGPRERIQIAGFYDDVARPTRRDRALMRAMPWDDALVRREAGVERFVLGTHGASALERLLFQPSATVCGFLSGYTGEGPKGIIPNRATAKLEFRIVPNQTPQRALQLLRSHLDRHGFQDISIRVLSTVETAKTDPDSAIVQAAAAAARALYGEPIIKPTEEYAGRQGVWVGNRLGRPGVGTGIGPPGHRGHATDEFVTVEHYIRGIKFAAAILEHYAAA